MRKLVEAFYRLLGLDSKTLTDAELVVYKALCRKYFALEADCQELERQVELFLQTGKGE